MEVEGVGTVGAVEGAVHQEAVVELREVAKVEREEARRPSLYACPSFAGVDPLEY